MGVRPPPSVRWREVPRWVVLAPVDGRQRLGRADMELRLRRRQRQQHLPGTATARWLQRGNSARTAPAARPARNLTAAGGGPGPGPLHGRSHCVGARRADVPRHPGVSAAVPTEHDGLRVQVRPRHRDLETQAIQAASKQRIGPPLPLSGWPVTPTSGLSLLNSVQGCPAECDVAQWEPERRWRPSK